MDAVGCLIVGIVLFAIVASWDDDNYYYSGYDSYYYSSYDDYNDYYILLYIDEDAATIWAVVCFIGASLWIAVAVCCFMFACCRINRYNRQNQSEGTDTSSKQAVVVASPEDQLVAAKSTAEKPDETESTHHEQPSEKKNTSGQGEEAC